ncbi:hypothetical protein BC567DRAFT_234406 [Phyllosticta citribraziliensis]
MVSFSDLVRAGTLGGSANLFAATDGPVSVELPVVDEAGFLPAAAAAVVVFPPLATHTFPLVLVGTAFLFAFSSSAAAFCLASCSSFVGIFSVIFLIPEVNWSTS